MLRFEGCSSPETFSNTRKCLSNLQGPFRSTDSIFLFVAKQKRNRFFFISWVSIGFLSLHVPTILLKNSLELNLFSFHNLFTKVLQNISSPLISSVVVVTLSSSSFVSGVFFHLSMSRSQMSNTKRKLRKKHKQITINMVEEPERTGRGRHKP